MTEEGGSAVCVKVRVVDLDVYLCPSGSNQATRHAKPGMKRERNGSACFWCRWDTLSIATIGRWIDLPVMPPAPLAERSRDEIEPARLSRTASALYAAYDELEFGDLKWGSMRNAAYQRQCISGAIFEAVGSTISEFRATGSSC